MTSKPRIVVAEDDEDLRVLIDHSLSGHFDVAGFGDGLTAWEALQAADAAALVTDITMPELDGLTLVRRMWQWPHTLEVPVIVVTGLVIGDPRVQELIATPGVEIMLKPFSSLALRQRVAEVVGRGNLGVPTG